MGVHLANILESSISLDLSVNMDVVISDCDETAACIRDD